MSQQAIGRAGRRVARGLLVGSAALAASGCLIISDTERIRAYDECAGIAGREAWQACRDRAGDARRTDDGDRRNAAGSRR